jgi:hypothetical protein
VTTTDTGGVLGTLNEMANPAIFLQPTALTESSAGIDALAAEVRLADPLEMIHVLMAAIADRVAYVTASSHAGTSAAEAFAAGTGVCQDHAHIFIAACRQHAIPARYVTGYMQVAGEDHAVAITPGRRQILPILAGSASIRPTGDARRSTMSGWPAVSMRHRRRRSWERGGAAAANGLTSMSLSSNSNKNGYCGQTPRLAIIGNGRVLIDS